MGPGEGLGTSFGCAVRASASRMRAFIMQGGNSSVPKVTVGRRLRQSSSREVIIPGRGPSNQQPAGSTRVGEVKEEAGADENLTAWKREREAPLPGTALGCYLPLSNKVLPRSSSSQDYAQQPSRRLSTAREMKFNGVCSQVMDEVHCCVVGWHSFRLLRTEGMPISRALACTYLRSSHL